MRWMIDCGITLRSNASTWPRTPAGPGRLPFSSTAVREAPKPRRLMVCAPVPPSVTKPANWWPIWVEPEATLDFCRNSAVLVWPTATLVSAVITCTGEVVSYSRRRSSEPVTVIFSSVLASSFLDSCVAGLSCAGASWAMAVVPYRQPNMAAASGSILRRLAFAWCRMLSP